MFIFSKEIVSLSKTSDIDTLAMELMKSYNVIDIAKALAEKIIAENDAPKKIVVSQEELNTIMSIFRVRGIAEDGTPIKSGRKRKDSPSD